MADFFHSLLHCFDLALEQQGLISEEELAKIVFHMLPDFLHRLIRCRRSMERWQAARHDARQVEESFVSKGVVGAQNLAEVNIIERSVARRQCPHGP
jgi:hypothetical protein